MDETPETSFVIKFPLGAATPGESVRPNTNPTLASTSASARRSIDLTQADHMVRVNDLYSLCARLVPMAEPTLDVTTRDGRCWFYVFLMWHEGSQLTTRTQFRGGPGRGLMQFEATTVWDTIKTYVMGATPGLVARLADAAGVDAQNEMKPALRAFAHRLNPNNVWPAESPENAIEKWLLENDSFGIELMQMHLKRFQAPLPPEAGSARAVNPSDPHVREQFAVAWADYWWKGPAALRDQRIASFRASADALAVRFAS